MENKNGIQLYLLNKMLHKDKVLLILSQEELIGICVVLGWFHKFSVISHYNPINWYHYWYWFHKAE